MDYSEGEVTIRVRTGVKVRIEEVDDLRDDDSRIQDDRHAHLIVPESLKLAVKRVTPGKDVGSAANIVTMCG